MTDALTLRSGAAWDQTPTQDPSPNFSGRTVQVPDETRVWLSFGASYDIAEEITIDAGYSYAFGLNDPVVRLRSAPPGSAHPSAPSVRTVEYDVGAHTFSIGGSFRF